MKIDPWRLRMLLARRCWTRFVVLASNTGGVLMTRHNL